MKYLLPLNSETRTTKRTVPDVGACSSWEFIVPRDYLTIIIIFTAKSVSKENENAERKVCVLSVPRNKKKARLENCLKFIALRRVWDEKDKRYSEKKRLLTGFRKTYVPARWNNQLAVFAVLRTCVCYNHTAFVVHE